MYHGYAPPTVVLPDGIKGAVVDLDDTVARARDVHGDVMLRALELAGVSKWRAAEIWYHWVAPWWGSPYRELIRHAASYFRGMKRCVMRPSTFERHYHRVLRLICKGELPLRYAPEEVPHARDLLTALHYQLDGRLVLYSASPYDLCKIVLRKLLLEKRFAHVVSAHPRKFRKEEPDGWLACCELLKLPPEAVVAFTDSMTDVRGACAAGLRVYLSPAPEQVEAVKQELSNEAFGSAVVLVDAWNNILRFPTEL
ncbi:MAG: HAD family hydrolase [Bdellovibrionales bacterium]|nr:HAD family hydrolase [Bdellovibrionales bacterium]